MKNRKEIVIFSIKITIFAKKYKPSMARISGFDGVFLGVSVVRF